MPSEPPTARLIRILETAPRMPLMRDRVRVDCVEVLKLVDVIASSAHAPGTGATVTFSLYRELVDNQRGLTPHRRRG